MNIHKVCSSSARIKILQAILYEDQLLAVSAIARELHFSKGLVSAYLNLLTKEGLLRRSGRKFSMQYNRLSKALKILLNINMLDMSIIKKYPFVKGVGVYGSVAKGTNTKDSDIDLWITIKKTNEENLSKLTKEVTKLGNVRPLYLTKEKLEIIRKKDPLFYHAIFFGSITLYGDELET